MRFALYNVPTTDSALQLFHPPSNRTFSRQIQALDLPRKRFTPFLLLRKTIAQRQHEVYLEDAGLREQHSRRFTEPWKYLHALTLFASGNQSLPVANETPRA
jgi:hypothetical protein